MKCILGVFLVWFAMETVQAKIYTRCGLTEDLNKLKFDRSLIGHCKLYLVHVYNFNVASFA